MAVNKNIEWFVGEDKVLDDHITGEDITGWSLQFDLYYRAGQTPLVTKTTSGGGITLSAPTTGDLEIAIDRADTVDLAADDYYFEVCRTNSGGNDVLTYGIATLLPRAVQT